MRTDTFSATVFASLLVASQVGFADPATKKPVADSTPSGGKMASIPGGTFTMGSEQVPFNKPHSVTVAAFSMDVNLVTAGDYDACIQAGKCTPGYPQTQCNNAHNGKEKHPVTCVVWDQATTYCAWVGKRLPTEEEWEYAARGGEKATEYSWGNADPTDQLCWKKATTCEVGSYPAGAFGLFDMNGNVWQWTASVGKNGGGGMSAFVKGSTFDSSDPSRGPGVGRSVRSANRHATPTDASNGAYGFRCAK